MGTGSSTGQWCGMSDVEDLFDQVEDEPIPGGCNRCDAYQVLTPDPDPNHAGIYYLTVRHDDWCPFLRARNAGAN